MGRRHRNQGHSNAYTACNSIESYSESVSQRRAFGSTVPGIRFATPADEDLIDDGPFARSFGEVTFAELDQRAHGETIRAFEDGFRGIACPSPHFSPGVRI